MIKTDFLRRGFVHEKLIQTDFVQCARKTSFRQISCTGVVRTTNVMQADFVQGVCARKMLWRQIGCTGAVRTKDRFRAKWVVSTKNVVKTDFIKNIPGNKNKYHSDRFRAQGGVRTKAVSSYAFRQLRL